MQHHETRQGPEDKAALPSAMLHKELKERAAHDVVPRLGTTAMATHVAGDLYTLRGGQYSMRELKVRELCSDNELFGFAEAEHDDLDGAGAAEVKAEGSSKSGSEERYTAWKLRITEDLKECAKEELPDDPVPRVTPSATIEVLMTVAAERLKVPRIMICL